MPVVDSEGYSEQPGEILLLSPMQKGPPKSRVQSRSVEAVVTCQYLVDKATHDLFMDWAKNQLFWGTQQIDDWPYPTAGATRRAYWFVGSPSCFGKAPRNPYIWLLAKRIYVLA
jgi:hypothetical protein